MRTKLFEIPLDPNNFDDKDIKLSGSKGGIFFPVVYKISIEPLSLQNSGLKSFTAILCYFFYVPAFRTWTVEMWSKFRALADIQEIIGEKIGSANQWGMLLHCNN